MSNSNHTYPIRRFSNSSILNILSGYWESNPALYAPHAYVLPLHYTPNTKSHISTHPVLCRAAGKRTQSLRTRIVRTTGILRPDKEHHSESYVLTACPRKSSCSGEVYYTPAKEYHRESCSRAVCSNILANTMTMVTLYRDSTK